MTIVLLACVLIVGGPQEAGGWVCPEVVAIGDRPFPRVTATPTELARLRAALTGEDTAARRVIAGVVREADRALSDAVEFPLRGGQHNQWYQCDACQIALRTVDATHHRCPSCGKVYSGEPYDDVLYARIHDRNLRAAATCGWAFALTGDEKYARRAAEVLTGYATRYRDYPLHSASRTRDRFGQRSGGHLFEQTLNEASAMANDIVPAYDLIHDWDGLSGSKRDQIETGLLRPMVENIAKYRAGKSNWQTWHNAALLAGGAVLGDRELVRRAITDPGNGFVDQMRISVSDDGMWYENSWGYHFYTLQAMIHIVESARRLDMDLWSHPRLQRMFTVGVDYAMPNGQFPRFGDDVNTGLRSMSASLEFARHAYGDQIPEAYLRLAPTWDSIMLGRTAGEVAQRPALRSRVFPAAGHAIMRTGGPRDLVSVLTFGPYGGFHGHFDKLSFVFYGGGQELGYDPGRARSQAYRLPIHTNWYKATLAHNTVVVDGRSQKPAAARLLTFSERPTCVALVAQCREGYPEVVHTRMMVQTADYLLVLDDLQGQQSHRYDWFYHDRGDSITTDPVCEARESAGEDTPGLEYVQNVRATTSDSAMRVRFHADQLTNVVTFDAAPATDLLIGDGVGGSVVDRVPLVRVTRRGPTARFAAVLEPCLPGQTPVVEAVACRDANGGLEVEITRRDGRDRIAADAEWNLVWP